MRSIAATTSLAPSEWERPGVRGPHSLSTSKSVPHPRERERAATSRVMNVGQNHSNGERIPRNESPRVEPLNRSSRRKEALTEIRNPKSEIRNCESLLTSAATRFRVRWPHSLSASIGERVGVRCRAAFFRCIAPGAREILNDGKYATDGELQFTLPDVLKVPPISHRGNVNEIIGKFGGADQLRNATALSHN